MAEDLFLKGKIHPPGNLIIASLRVLFHRGRRQASDHPRNARHPREHLVQLAPSENAFLAIQLDLEMRLGVVRAVFPVYIDEPVTHEISDLARAVQKVGHATTKPSPCPSSNRYRARPRSCRRRAANACACPRRATCPTRGRALPARPPGRASPSSRPAHPPSRPRVAARTPSSDPPIVPPCRVGAADV